MTIITLTLPASFTSATDKVVALISKEQGAIAKAMAYTLDHIGGPAQTFSAEHDAFANATGSPLVKKSGNVNDVQVREAMLAANVTLPSKSVIDRVLRIGRNLPQGEVDATLARYKDATWTQPDDAVADGAVAVEVTNARTVQAFDTWLQYAFGKMSDTNRNTFSMVDDVLMKAEDHAALCAIPVVEEPGTEDSTEDSTEDKESSDDKPGTVPTVAKNVVNTGALLAVFATCDDATISAAVQHDLSQYGDDAVELRALALSALALAEMLDRNAVPAETVEATA